MSHFLPHNELPATLRLVNRTLAQQLKQPQHTTIRLSHACPPHAFQRHWAAPGATRGLRLHDRRRLLRLTARSGVVENLDVAIAAVDCCLATEVLAAAAGANRLAVAEHLRSDRYGVALGGEVLVAAAGAGRASMVEWCLAQGCASDKAAAAAAKHGHRAVLDRLLGRTSAEGSSTGTPASPTAAAGAAVGRVDVAALLEGAARGMPLAVLQQLHEEHSVRLPERRVAGGGADGGGGGGAEGPGAADVDGGGGNGGGGGAAAGAIRMPPLTRREQVKITEAAAASPAVLAASATPPPAAPVAEAEADADASSAPEEEPVEDAIEAAVSSGLASTTVAAAGAPPPPAWTASATSAAGSGLRPIAAAAADGRESQLHGAAGEQAGTDGLGTAVGGSQATLDAEPEAGDAEDAGDAAPGMEPDTDLAAETTLAIASAEAAAPEPAQPEPAWRAKLRWLESQQYPKPAEAWSAVAAMSPPSCGCGSNQGSGTGSSSCRHLRAGCCLARVSCQGTCAAAAGSAAASGSGNSGGGSSSSGSSTAAQGADWCERFEYLRSAGYPLNVAEALRRAASAGHEAALQYLLATREGRRLVQGMRRARPGRTEGVREVAGALGANGNEAGVQQADEAGWPGEGPRLGLGPGPGELGDDDEGPGSAAVSGTDALHAVSRAARAAARGGHVGVLRILAALGLDLKQVPLLLSAAVRKRQLECAAWLLEQVFGLPPQSTSVTDMGENVDRAVPGCGAGDATGSNGTAVVVGGLMAAAGSGGDRVGAMAACGEITPAEPDQPPKPGVTVTGGTASAAPAQVSLPPPGLLTRTLLLSAAGSGCPKMVAFVHERLRVGGASSSGTSGNNGSSDSNNIGGSAGDAAGVAGCSCSRLAGAGVAGPYEGPSGQTREERYVAYPEQQGFSAAGGTDVPEMPAAASFGPPSVDNAAVAAGAGAAPSLETPPPLAFASDNDRQDAVPAGVPEAFAATSASAAATAAASAESDVAASPEEDEDDESKEPQPAWDEAAWTAAAKAGCVEVLEQLASYGCPMGNTGDAYVTAARNGDLATLRCLHRLGCPWGPARPQASEEDSDDSFDFLAGLSTVFARAVTATARREWSGLPVLQLLLDLGCPVDWDEAASRARDFRHSKPATWLWVAAQQAKAEAGESGKGAAGGKRRQVRGRGRARQRMEIGAGGAAGVVGSGLKRCVALAVLGFCAFAARSIWYRRTAGRR